jgi:hypothetical protein
MISRIDELRMFQQGKKDSDLLVHIKSTETTFVPLAFQIEDELIDKVFVMSKLFDPDSILDFITALCIVSKL